MTGFLLYSAINLLQCCMLQGIFGCFNVLSSSMSSSVAKKDLSEEQDGLASLEVNNKNQNDLVFTKDEVLDWLEKALLRFVSSTWTNKSTDEILYNAMDVSQAAQCMKTFDVCEKSRAMMSGLFTKQALEMVEQTQDKSKLQTFARQVVALAKLNCRTVRAKTMYPCKYEDIFEACPDLCQSFQDFTYTKDEALESLADAIVCFCASRPDSDDFLFLAVKVSQAVILVNTSWTCATQYPTCWHTSKPRKPLQWFNNTKVMPTSTSSSSEPKRKPC